VAVSNSRQTDRLKLLLGEKETVAFEASGIADGHAKVSKDILDALMLAALFVASGPGPPPDLSGARPTEGG
jgi:hypothetical protein